MGTRIGRTYAHVVVFCALASTFWPHLLGTFGTGVLVTALTVMSAVLCVRQRLVRWEAVSVVQLAFVALAGVSLLWSAWPAVTVITAGLLVATTVQGILVGSVLTLLELVRSLDLSLRWILGLSLVLEVWVAGVLRHPLSSGTLPTDDATDAWVEGNLLTEGRIQGIVGNANTLGILCALSLLLIVHRMVARRRVDVASVGFFALAAYLLMRSESVTSIIALGVCALLFTVILIRRVPAIRTRLMLLVGLTAVTAATTGVAWAHKDGVLAAIGRDSSLTGRAQIWEAVMERALNRPVIGHGYASPWLPMVPEFSEWRIDHGRVVAQAHSMWVDVFLQLGIVGVILVGIVYLVLWGRAARLAFIAPAGSGKVIPFVMASLLLVQGVTESSPMMTWGWLLVVSMTMLMPRAAPAGVPVRTGDLAVTAVPSR